MVKILDPFDYTVGTLQGSPVSPVLSIIYISFLLYKMKNWNKLLLDIYIDDSVIFACRRSWTSITLSMCGNYRECIEWLMRASLNVEPEKLKLIFFKKKGQPADYPSYIHLSNLTLNTYYRVHVVNTLHYLVSSLMSA